MGYELKKLMQQFGVSTPTMAAAPQMPGAAPKAITELVKPELRAQPVEPVKPAKPSNNAPAAEKEAYQVALTAYNAQKGAYETDLKAWKTESKAYDTALKDYNTALPKYQEDLAKYETDKAAFDETVRKYGLDKAQYDQYAKDYQNRLANTNLYNQAQFSTTGANVPAFTTYSDAQKAALGYGPAVTPTVGAPTVPDPNSGGTGSLAVIVGPDGMPMQPGPQDFTGIGQGGLNQQIQNYMGTNPSMPDLNAYMTRYGLTNYDIRNAMGTGTTYGAPQWTDMLASPVYSAPITTMPVDTGGGTGGTTTGGTTGTTTNPTAQDGDRGGRDRDGMGGMGGVGRPGNGTGTGSFGLPDPFGGGSRTTFGGYTGLRDMFDGGGPGGPGTRGGYTGLRDMFDGGGPGRSRPKAEGGYIQNYAQGGAVQGYQRGGPPGTIYGGAGDDMLMGRPADDMLAPAPAPVAEDPLMAMLERYAPKPVDYSSQIAAATERRAAEQKAFEELLMGQLNAQDSAPQSKAEMYFRLAAAFGAPTKTGHFSENLALVGQTLAEDLAAKAQREREKRAAKLGVQTELQKMRMEAAGEDLSTLQGMQESETKYGREMAKDMLDKYITSGKPQSEAGKIATDMGLKPGTPEYNEKVREITELKIQREVAAIEAQLASTAAQQTQANQMNATEIKLRSETEDVLAGVGQSLEDLKEAYRLNPNTFAGGLYDKFVLGAKELAGSDDPKVVNTRMLQNLLESQALEKLKATFGGSGITNAEREALSALQGAGAKSTEERGQIILRAYEVLQDIQARQTKKLDEILSGAYRQYKPIDGGE